MTPMGATDHILLNSDLRPPATWPLTGAGSNTAEASSSIIISSSSIDGDDGEYHCPPESAISAVHVQRAAVRLRGGGASVLPSALLRQVAAVQAQQQQQQQVQVQRQKSKQPPGPNYRGGGRVNIPPFIIDPHTPWMPAPSVIGAPKRTPPLQAGDAQSDALANIRRPKAVPMTPRPVAVRSA